MPQSTSPLPHLSNHEKNTATNHLFCYEIDGTHIFIESGIKMEVLEQSIIYPIPNAPKWFSGVTSLRGDILPIVNMHFLLNAKQNSKTKRLLKLKHPDFTSLVIGIDGLPHQNNTDNLQPSNNPNKTQYPEWITSTSTYNNHIFLFANHATLFSAIQNNSTTTQSTGDNQ